MPLSRERIILGGSKIQASDVAFLSIIASPRRSCSDDGTTVEWLPIQRARRAMNAG